MNEDADLLNRGKANTAINLKSAEGHDQLFELLSNADVLIDGVRLASVRGAAGILTAADVTLASVDRSIASIDQIRAGIA